MSGAGRGSPRVSPTGIFPNPATGTDGTTLVSFGTTTSLFDPFGWRFTNNQGPLLLNASNQTYPWKPAGAVGSFGNLLLPLGLTRIALFTTFTGLAGIKANLQISFDGQRMFAPASQSSTPPNTLIGLAKASYVIEEPSNGILELNVPPMATLMSIDVNEIGAPATPGAFNVYLVTGDNQGFSGVQNNISV